MKITKNNLLLGGILLVSAAFLPCHSKALDIGTIFGTAKTVGDAIVGQTTVTPAYALNSWTQRSWGNYLNNFFGVDIWYSFRYSVKRDPVTQTYFYQSTYSGPGGGWSDTTPFF